jgi:AraC-like DNA-binding protein
MESHYQAVQRVIQAMHEKMEESLSLRTMSRIAFVSPYHFNRVFRQITGIPPSQFLYALRLEAAKRLLLTTRLSVIEVCYTVGYNSLGTFTRRFTDLVGLSPTRLRTMAQFPINPMSFWTDRAESAPGEQSGLALNGEVSAPWDFEGMIFIGLFTSPIPQGMPVACALINGPGQYSMSHLPEGHYYLLAAGLNLSGDPKEYFCYESALRGGGQMISINNGTVTGSPDLSLRLPAAFDPPILMTFPPLLAGHAWNKEAPLDLPGHPEQLEALSVAATAADTV